MPEYSSRRFKRGKLPLRHRPASGVAGKIRCPSRVRKLAEIKDRWLSADEIGKYLGVSSDTVYRWINRHAMPAHRMGRLWKFKRDEVDAWMKTGGAADKPDTGQ